MDDWSVLSHDIKVALNALKAKIALIVYELGFVEVNIYIYIYCEKVVHKASDCWSNQALGICSQEDGWEQEQNSWCMF